jgi:carbon storage regulator
VLVFTRKKNEAIIIGDGIEVRVLRVGRDGVRLGVAAPTTVPVHRQEIYEQICAENRTAAVAATAGPGLIQRLRRLAGPADEGDGASGRAVETPLVTAITGGTR